MLLFLEKRVCASVLGEGMRQIGVPWRVVCLGMERQKWTSTSTFLYWDFLKCLLNVHYFVILNKK